MKTGKRKIIELLYADDNWITSSYLASAAEISPRSVKTYIQELNEEFPDLIVSSRGNGYRIDHHQASLILAQEKKQVPQSKQERIAYIINRIIKSKEVDIYDLCDEMFISYSTIKSVLSGVRRKLAGEDLILKNKNDHLSVEGLEKNKRKLLSTMMYSETKNNFVDYSTIGTKFVDIDVMLVRRIIIDTFQKEHYFINDYSLDNLVLHTVITIDRIRKGFSTTDTVTTDQLICYHEHQLAVQIITQIESAFGIQVNNAEAAEFTILLLSRTTNLNYTAISPENIKNYVGESCISIADKIIDSFNAYFYLDLNDPEFYVRFSLHLKNMLTRASNNYFSKNPMTTSIKVQCPLIYDAAVHAASIVKDEINIELTDDEIAYIAIHIGSALEMKDKVSNKIKVCIYYPQYYDVHNFFKERLEKEFKKNILISNIVTREEELVYENADLIISVIGLNGPARKAFIQVSPFLTEHDLQRIDQKVKQINQFQKQQKFKNYLQHFIRPELFEHKKNFSSKEEVIMFMVRKLEQNGYVEPDFEQAVLDRDRISSTAFENFAIPHSMVMDAKKTGIEILILDQALSWDQAKVNLVLMLCFNRNDRHIFNEIFEPITMILTDKYNFDQLIKTDSAQSFIETITSMLTF